MHSLVAPGAGRKTRYAVAGLSIGTAACLMLAGCSSSGGNASVSGAGSTQGGSGSVSIGMSNPLSGTAAADCGNTGRAAKAVVDHVNSSGGVDGIKINLDLKDDQNSATLALGNARAFIQDKDIAVLGGCGSTPTSTLAPFLQNAGIPFLFPLAPSLPNLVTPVQSNIFNLYPLYEHEFNALLAKEFQAKGSGSVYIVNLQGAGSGPLTAAVQKDVTSNGGTNVGTDYEAHDAADFTPVALKIKNAKPDYLVVILSSALAGKLINTLVSQNALPSHDILVSGYDFSSSFNAAAGSAISKVVGVGPTPPGTDPKASSCSTILTAAKIPLTDYAVWGCVEVQALEAAISDAKAAGGVTTSNLLKALNSWNGKSVSPLLGPVSFSPSNHDGSGAQYETAVQNGKVVSLGTIGGK